MTQQFSTASPPHITVMHHEVTPSLTYGHNACTTGARSLLHRCGALPLFGVSIVAHVDPTLQEVTFTPRYANRTYTQRDRDTDTYTDIDNFVLAQLP